MATTKISDAGAHAAAAGTDRIPASKGGTKGYLTNTLIATWLAQSALAAGTLTDPAPMTLTQTWNDAADTFTGFKVNITDSASAAASLLMDLQVGGSTKFNVRKDGRVFTAEAYAWSDANLCNFEGSRFWFQSGATIFATTYNGGTFWGSALSIGFASTSNAGLGGDTAIARGAAKVLSFTDGASAGGTFRTIARTPSQITSNQDNYNPGGSSYFQRWSSDASRNVTGMTFTATQVDGQRHEIWNVGAQNIVLQHDVTSTAANRWQTSTGADLTLAAGKCAFVVYDGTISRWRVCLGA